MIYVLDASAMIALLRNEPGGDVVADRLAQPDATTYAHAINLCEVYYDFYRNDSDVAAERAIEVLKSLGVIERNDFDEAFWKEVGRLKATQACPGLSSSDERVMKTYREACVSPGTSGIRPAANRDAYFMQASR